MGLEDLIAKQMGTSLVPEGEEQKPVEQPEGEAQSPEGAPETAPEEKQDVPTNTDEPSEGDNQPQSQSFEELLIEKSGGKFNSYDDVVNALNDIPTESEPQFANEQLAKLNEYVSQGGDLKTFVETQLKDFSAFDDLGLIKEKMKMDDPELTSEEIDLILNDKFKLDEDEYSESEIKLSKVKLRKEARQAREFFDKFQKENAVPAGVADNEAAAKAQAEQKATMEAQQKEWENTLNTQLGELSHVEFSLGGEEAFKFEVSDSIKSEIKDSVTFINNFWNRYLDKDGNVDHPKFLKDMTRIMAGDKLDAFIASQARSQGKEEFSRELENPSYTPNDKGAGGQSPESLRSQIWRELNK